MLILPYIQNVNIESFFWNLILNILHSSIWTLSLALSICQYWPYETSHLTAKTFFIILTIINRYHFLTKPKWTTLKNFILHHYVKSVQIRSFFWSVFSCIRTEYGELLHKSTYSFQIQENTDQRKLRIRTLFTQCMRQLLAMTKILLGWQNRLKLFLKLNPYSLILLEVSRKELSPQVSQKSLKTCKSNCKILLKLQKLNIINKFQKSYVIHLWALNVIGRYEKDSLIEQNSLYSTNLPW